MQSLFRRAWNQDQTADKKPEKALLQHQRMRPSPMVEIPSFLRMKRRRSDSPEQAQSQSLNQGNFKKRKILDIERPAQLSSENRPLEAQIKEDGYVEEHTARQAYPVPTPHAKTSTSTSGASPSSKPTIVMTGDLPGTETKSPLAADQVDASSTTKPHVADKTQSRSDMRQIIEHQFNLEILLKHRELRLIEQELAKCQTALEQLRRCEIVPFPGSLGLDEDVSAGTGPSLRAKPGFTQPQTPSPWGVVDGPYTRHYSRWLLNDPAFDSIPVSQTQVPADYFSTAPEGRSTRNSGAGLGRAGKSRPSRDSVGNFSHALPNYPMQGRGKGGPLVIKRLADNLFVKLICNNCQRGDFSSVQGFLNHCRIAHKVDYKSHEAAATDCGRPLEEDESHLIPQATPATTAATRTPGPRVVAPAPASVTQPPPNGLVHPLNAPVMPRYTWKVQAAAARAALAAAQEERTAPHSLRDGKSVPKDKTTSSAAQLFHSAPLVSSSSTPYLSTQFAKRGLGGDLNHAATRACEKFDLGPDLVDDDETSVATSRKQSLSKPGPGMSGMRFTQPSSAIDTGRPQSRKGQQVSMSRPLPSPLPSQSTYTSSLRGSAAEIPESPQESNLSPHAADSNPGLVSDDEDDEAASDDEARSERHASPEAPLTQLNGVRRRIGACGADAMDVDVEFEDDGDGHHGVLIRPRGLAFQEFSQRSAGSSSQRPVSRFGEAAK